MRTKIGNLLQANCQIIFDLSKKKNMDGEFKKIVTFTSTRGTLRIQITTLTTDST